MVRRSGGFTLVEMVVALAIVVVLAAVLYGLVNGKGKKGGRHGDLLDKTKAQSIPGKALERARSVACDNYLTQCKQAVDMEAQDLGYFPPAIPADMASVAKCPDSGQPFQYDPTTGRVWCPYHQPALATPAQN